MRGRSGRELVGPGASRMHVPLFVTCGCPYSGTGITNLPCSWYAVLVEVSGPRSHQRRLQTARGRDSAVPVEARAGHDGSPVRNGHRQCLGRAVSCEHAGVTDARVWRARTARLVLPGIFDDNVCICSHRGNKQPPGIHRLITPTPATPMPCI